MMDFQILVISLPEPNRRRETVALEMGKTSLSWKFLDATEGSLLTEPVFGYDPRKVKRLLGFELTRRELGCFISHKRAWQECVEKNIITIVFEDDLYLLPHFREVINFLVRECLDWDAVRLQGLNEVPQMIIKNIDKFALVENLNDPVGATAYIIKPSAAIKLLKAAQDIYEPLDHFLEHYLVHKVSFPAVYPYPVVTNRAASTISDRSIRHPILGWPKLRRSFLRFLDRLASDHPWFPK